MPKGQFIRIKRICSEEKDFDSHAQVMKTHFVARGYSEKNLDRTITEVKKLKREDLLKDKDLNSSKDPQSIFVCTWHPKLNNLKLLLQECHKILDADPRLKKIFTEKPTVAFRRKKNIGNHLCRSDDREKKPTKKEKCKGCILCKQMKEGDILKNHKAGTQVELKPGATCKTEGIIYAVRCKKCDLLYIGHSGDHMSKRFSGHKHDIKKRPNQNELSQHCHQHSHDPVQDLEISIIDHGIKGLQERERLEDFHICKLQTMAPYGLNSSIHAYAKEMYTSWSSVTINNESKSN